MREYKREKQTLEGQVADLEKRSAYHDDHIRAIDLWFTQVRGRKPLSMEQHADGLYAYSW